MIAPLDPAAWRRLKQVFDRAVTLRPGDRADYLDSVCEGDDAFRLEIERLLTSHEAASTFMEIPAAALSDAVSAATLIGRSLGPYALSRRIGAGGMGEVYEAVDTRLGRTVAVKVLAAHMARDPQFRERFEREARAIAAVSHPHICTIYDVGHVDDFDFIVMEYLKGETVADRLSRSPLPLKQAACYGIEIVSALRHAHAVGVVHRDLKPANVMITESGTKLLDFGLAKLAAPQPVSGMAPDALTNPGVVMGTVHYLAPEQLEGKPVDARTDIFAFGALFYEMLSGRRAFDGLSEAAVITAIRTYDPPSICDSRPDVPASIDRVVHACLTKDRNDRWQSTRDLLRELTWIAETLDSPPAIAAARAHAPRLRAASIAGGILLGAACALGAVAILRSPAPAPPAVRFEVPTPDSSEPLSFAVSPDGRALAFVATSNGVPQIWLRALDQTRAAPLRGTDGATYPFWPPDSASIGFFAGGKVKRLGIVGGEPLVLADAPSGRGGTWNTAGDIVFAPSVASGLQRVSARGGIVTPITRVATGENSHRWPQFLPDGRHFLYQSVHAATHGLFVGSLDDDRPRRVRGEEEPPVFAAPDRLLVAHQGGLAALQFDVENATVRGEPASVATSVGIDAAYVAGAFSASATGVLAYRPGAAEPRQLVWMDRAGRIIGHVGASDEDGLANPELAPDGRRVSVDRAHAGNMDIWVVDVETGVRSRLTFDDGIDFLSVWSADNQRVIFSSNRNVNNDLFERSASGVGEDRVVAQSTTPKIPTSVSRDGRWLLYEVQVPTTGVDIWALPLKDANPKPIPVVQTVYDETGAQISPDGDWIAYQSNASGSIEIYLRHFPEASLDRQISTAGGTQPRWSADGRELYYVSAEGNLVAVTVHTRSGTVVDSSVPRTLFRVPLATGINIYAAIGTRPQYAVSVDGRFLVNMPVAGATLPPIVVSTHWTAPFLATR